MLKQTLLSTVLAIAIVGPLAAQQTDQAPVNTPPALQAQRLPETQIIDYTFVFTASESASPAPALLTEIATWLVANFDLPVSDLLPRIEFASSWADRRHPLSRIAGRTAAICSWQRSGIGRWRWRDCSRL